MTLEQRKDIMRQASRTAMSRYDDAERQAAFAQGYVYCAVKIDIDLMTIKDISEKEPAVGERVFAVSVEYRTDDDFDIDVQALNYDKELFAKLGVRYWLPFTINVSYKTETK